MSKYQTGKIFCLRSFQTPKVYIGATIKTLSVKREKILNDYNKYLQTNKGYYTAFEICKYNDCYIQLIEYYSCKSKQQLKDRVFLYRLNNNSVMV